jgi:hypothetical protein
MVPHIARQFVMALLLASPAFAQHDEASAARTAPAEAKQFSFLIGQFDVVVHPAVPGLAARIHGVPKLVGTWKGWKAMDGYGIEDELRITDESGNPRNLSHAVRYFDATAKRWLTNTIDVFRGVSGSSTGEWKDNAIVMVSHGTDSEGKVYAMRGRYYDITPTSFKFRQERSYDEGKTWDSAVLTIDATRVAAVAPR